LSVCYLPSDDEEAQMVSGALGIQLVLPTLILDELRQLLDNIDRIILGVDHDRQLHF
jgi:uncharacterized FAD-dependent dehydrogenase